MSTEGEESSVSLTQDYPNNMESENHLHSTTVPELKPQSSRKDGRNVRWLIVLRIVVILIVSVLLTLPLILFHLQRQKGQGDVQVNCVRRNSFCYIKRVFDMPCIVILAMYHWGT